MKLLAISLFRLDEWIPQFSGILTSVNKALRNINRGHMDFLPYSSEIEPFEWYMEAQLTPQGPDRAPSVGHWQIRIRHDNGMPDIILQGKSRDNEERGLLAFHCTDTTWENLAALWPERD